MQPEQILSSLDPQQRVVAQEILGPMAVVAGAGTGKTRAITHRIAYACAVGAFDPKSVMAVTFTTKAAGELRARLTQLGVPSVAASTFHSAALRQLRYFWPQMYQVPLPKVLPQRERILTQAMRRWRIQADPANLRDIGTEITWAKVSNVTADNYPELARAHNRELTQVEPVTVARIMATYEELKLDQHMMDFEDILLYTAAMLMEHEHIATQVRRVYRCFVVDEYQDVSPIQEALLRLWVGGRKDICVVGDPAQTIHSFAGAKADFLQQFKKRFTKAKQVELVRDYRSSPQIVSLANQVMANRGAVTLISQHKPGPAPQIVGFSTPSKEAQEVAAWIRQLSVQGVAWKDMAVLYRTNAQSKLLELAFSELDVPYVVHDGDNNHEHIDTDDVVSLYTLHAAKGLEWEAVALYGIQEGFVPYVLARTQAEVAEERRLFYVGITRARKYLHISWSADIKNLASYAAQNVQLAIAKNQSRFLADITVN